jgi:AhpD family alkylhydroperoxidase
VWVEQQQHARVAHVRDDDVRDDHGDDDERDDHGDDDVRHDDGHNNVRDGHEDDGGLVSRIPLLEVDQAPLLARSWYRGDGSASPLTRSLANSPDLLETLMPFLGQIMGESSLDLATKELVIVRVSQLNGCRYCLAAHRPLALGAGVSAEHLEAVCDAEPLGALSERERAIVDWVDRVTIDPAAVDDRVHARALEWIREDELVELTILAGAIGMLNRYCTALDIPPPG